MKIKHITSMQNETYKNLLKLQRSSRMRKENVFLIEGIRSFKELIKAHEYTIQSLWLEEDLAEKLTGEVMDRLAVPIYVVSKEMLQKASDTVTSQGILAVVKRKSRVFEEELQKALEKDNPLIIVLERIQDPGNMGTIIRTADAAGCSLMIVTDDCTDEFSPKVVRAAMGSLLHVPVVHVPSVKEAADVLKKNQIQILAGHLQGKVFPYDIDLKKSTAVLIGNEGSGLSEEASQKADVLVKLPMVGQAESLNASIAAGILMYEVVRQRTNDYSIH